MPITKCPSPTSGWYLQTVIAQAMLGWESQGFGSVLQMSQKNPITLIPPLVLKILRHIRMCHFVNSHGLENESFSSHSHPFLPVAPCQCLVTLHGKAGSSLSLSLAAACSESRSRIPHPSLAAVGPRCVQGLGFWLVENKLRNHLASVSPSHRTAVPLCPPCLSHTGPEYLGPASQHLSILDPFPPGHGKGSIPGAAPGHPSLPAPQQRSPACHKAPSQHLLTLPRTGKDPTTIE